MSERTFRLRRSDGGSALRGGDGFRFPVEIDAAAVTFRFRRADGGSALRGGAAIRWVEAQAQTFEYLADGGIQYGGTADVSRTFAFAAAGGISYAGTVTVTFTPAPAFEPTRPQGHGAGRRHELRTRGVPLPDYERRLTGRAVTRCYIADGGIRWGGAAGARLVRYSVVYVAPASAAGLRWSGKAQAWRGNDDDDDLALAA